MADAAVHDCAYIGPVYGPAGHDIFIDCRRDGGCKEFFHRNIVDIPEGRFAHDLQDVYLVCVADDLTEQPLPVIQRIRKIQDVVETDSLLDQIFFFACRFTGLSLPYV